VATATAPAQPRQRTTIVALLLLASAVAWAGLVSLAAGMEDDDEAMLTMGMGGPLFLATWATMMAAMMLPAASPMVDAFARVQASRRGTATGPVPTVAFVVGYLLVWCSVGVLAFGAARALENLSMDHAWLMDNGARLGGALIVAAGIYQLSPLKRICLGRCRTPMSFIVTSWRDGTVGAVRMGLEHGLFCLGCCWLLFALLFPLGIMNVAAMAGVTLLIVAEKILPWETVVVRAAAAILVGYGLLVLALPDALPTMM
jgi:predicted metal-binding membrane protein